MGNNRIFDESLKNLSLKVVIKVLAVKNHNKAMYKTNILLNHYINAMNLIF